MGTNQDYKNRALADLEGNWGTAAIITLVLALITGVPGQFLGMTFDTVTGMGISSAWNLLCLPMTWGYMVLFLSLTRKEAFKIEGLFDGYKDFVRVFLAQLLIGIACFVGFLCLIVPGFILWLMFSMTNFILKDDAGLSSIDAMKKSAEIMSGHKMELFWLFLSFIGWFILCFLTLGIGFLFLIPYMQTAQAHFYEDLKAEKRGINPSF